MKTGDKVIEYIFKCIEKYAVGNNGITKEEYHSILDEIALKASSENGNKSE